MFLPKQSESGSSGKKTRPTKKHYFNVKMPNDDPASKEAIKMVAATLIEDREFHRTLDALGFFFFFF